MSKNVYELDRHAKVCDQLTEVIRTGAAMILRQALEAEIQDQLAHYSERLLEDGRAGVVRNGYLPERDIQTGIGPVSVRVPKIRSKTGEPVTFRSAWCHPMSARRDLWTRPFPGCT